MLSAYFRQVCLSCSRCRQKNPRRYTAAHCSPVLHCCCTRSYTYEVRMCCEVRSIYLMKNHPFTFTPHRTRVKKIKTKISEKDQLNYRAAIHTIYHLHILVLLCTLLLVTRDPMARSRDLGVRCGIGWLTNRREESNPCFLLRTSRSQASRPEQRLLLSLSTSIHSPVTQARPEAVSGLLLLLLRL